MSYEKVKEYFDSKGLAERVIVREHIGDTVEHAAQSIGCSPARIAKAMSFVVNEKPVLVVMAGDTKVDNHKFKVHFHQKAVMLPGSQVEELIGHEPGAVCPFAVNEFLSAWLGGILVSTALSYTALWITDLCLGVVAAVANFKARD